ncbi:MAG TPA: protoporphyrinogen oxidase [Thermoanaerobaculia bacterium]|jgi:oxygen-dependent protoporphyrinogen oxidase|nr:protoporphyrinogen oxidase [Thermoanaerobaculia bacterium]
MSGARLDTVVVGGGISGLTTAFHLARAGRRVAVLEASGLVGGAIETFSDGDWRFEMGPNTVLENNPSVGRLLRDSGMEGEKITAAPSAKKRYLYKGGRLVPLPGGPGGFVTTPLFPLGAKFRLLREPWIGRPPADTEETIAQFVRRRLGQPFLDYAVGPFVSGVYAGDPERLSVRWAVPKIYGLEEQHGSLIRGALARRKGPAPGGAMISFREGLEELPRKLAREIGDVRTGVLCHSVARTLTAGGFRVETSAGPVEAAKVVLAVPSDVAARLLDEATAGASRLLAEIPYAAVVILSLGFRREAVGHPLAGFGFLAPRKEGLHTLGCLFPSEIFPGRAPAGHVALAAFAGGRTNPEIVGWDDERLVSTLLGELRGPLRLQGEPAFRLVRRWPRAIPQYELGHGRFVERAREIERALPGLRLGGNYLGGISVPDCIRNATAMADEMAEAG